VRDFRWLQAKNSAIVSASRVEWRNQGGFRPVPIPPSDRKIIVLVEQDAQNRDKFQRVLLDAGFNVFCFSDYLGALNEAESNRRLDLLITGVRLPAGTPHGLSLAAMVKLRRPRLPVLFLADANDLALMTDEPSPVLVKPVDASALVQATTQLIGEGH